MYLLCLACAYLAACYLFGGYLLIRLITGRRLRSWLSRMINPLAVSWRPCTVPIESVGQEAGRPEVT